MGFGQSLGNLCRDANSFAKRQWRGTDQRTQRLTANHFHRDVVHVVDVTEFVNCDDVRVVQRRCGLGFALKSAESLLIVGYLVVQEFKGDRTA